MITCSSEQNLLASRAATTEDSEAKRYSVTFPTQGPLTPDTLTVFYFSEQIAIEDLAGITEYFKRAPEIDDQGRVSIVNQISSTNEDAVVTGFAVSDFILGLGTLRGGGGDDFVVVDDAMNPDGTEIDVTQRSVAFGGKADDVIGVNVDHARVAGGAGNDRIFFSEGHAVAKGGQGNDSFIFVSDENADDTQVNAILKDFNVAEDRLEFGGSTRDFPDSREGRTLEEIFGEGVLSNDDSFTIDGVTLTFQQQQNGNTIIFREGTGSDGNVFDERVVLRDTDILNIDRADVTLYADFSTWDV